MVSVSDIAAKKTPKAPSINPNNNELIINCLEKFDINNIRRKDYIKKRWGLMM
jgi:hypothetical protein